MAAAIAFAPIVDMVLSCQWFVAQCATRGDVVFVAGGVKRPFFIHIKLPICNRLLASGATKMLGMPVRVEGSEKTAVNFFSTLSTKSNYWYVIDDALTLKIRSLISSTTVSHSII